MIRSILPALLLFAATAAAQTTRPATRPGGDSNRQATTQPAGKRVGGFYSGRLGSRWIRASLWVDKPLVQGWYFYEDFNSLIRLAGLVDSEGAVSLKEWVSKGEITGRWSGVLDHSDEFKGEWSAPDGGRKAGIRLLKVGDYLRYVESGKVLHSEVTVPDLASIDTDDKAYAGVQAKPLQRAIARALADRKKDLLKTYPDARKLRFEAACVVTLLHKEAAGFLLIISEQVDDADASMLMEPLNLHVDAKGVAHRLKIGDLFRPKKVPVLRFAVLIRNQLKRRGATDIPSIRERSDLQSFCMTRTGLMFIYPPGAVGKVAEGPYTAGIEWEQVNEFFDKTKPGHKLFVDAMKNSGRSLPRIDSLED
ncbi:MAG: RsiV family protein [Phycisphaerae bacterium]